MDKGREKITDTVTARAAQKGELVTFRNFSFTYPGRNTPALQNVNVAIRDGEFILVAGRSGCGKSTLAKALCGFLRKGAKSGGVFFRDRDITFSTTVDLAGRVGYVQQDPESQIVSLTVEEEIAFGLENFSVPREEILKRIRWSLEAVDGMSLQKRETLQLSGGEKQKVAAASVLAMMPDMVILDEPTSGLDPRSTEDVLHAVQSFRRTGNMTVVVLEHNISRFLPFADRILVMDQGGIVLDIPTNQVVAHVEALQRRGVRLPGMLKEEKNLKTPGEQKKALSLLSISNLHVMREEQEVLKGVSLDVHPGEIVSLMGDNGSGKTTLLLTVMELLDKTGGSVSIFGCAPGERRTSRIARHSGLVFQNPLHQLFEETLVEEVGFAPNNFGMSWSKRDGYAALEAFGLMDMADRSPFSLSHGEKRRLNLASVCAYGPKLMLLDEPFIGQDMDNTLLLLKIISSHASSGGGVLMVSHDAELTGVLAHRVVFLKSGRVVADGPPKYVFGRLAALGKTEYLPRALKVTQEDALKDAPEGS